MGHHALAHGRTSLLVGKQWLGEIEMNERESGWFESKRSQSIHGKHNNMQMRSVLKVTPHPSFIVFLRDFGVFPTLQIETSIKNRSLLSRTRYLGGNIHNLSQLMETLG